MAHPRGQKLRPAERERLRKMAASGVYRTGVELALAAGVSKGTGEKFLRDVRDAAAEGAPAVEPPSPEERSTRDRRLVQLEDENRDLKAKLRDTHRDSLSTEAVLEVLGVMASSTAEPPDWLRRVPVRGDGPTPEVPVTIWSDWHYGEVVSAAETSGVNEFNIEIAERRIRRLTDATIDICNNHGPGKYPGIVVNLLGDFVSGGLHPELAKTDEEGVIPSSLRVRDVLITALTRMADNFGHVYAPCAAGNHGRATPRPEFKRYYAQNFDWLIYQLLARHFANDDRVKIDVRPSNEIHYRVFGQRFLAMHGDMLGVKGGDGIIGAIGPIMRGEIKTRGQATSIGLDYDILLMGHWHQSLWLPRAIVNNALKGFDEYAKNALRASPSEPSQALFFVHPSRGITSRWDVRVGEPKAPAREWVTWAT
jgi:hypothetical protein